ncbi:MAG: DNA polymerase III subunit delta, partial [Candidatus Heimdallarchaeota archaeon]|nr:DNA polymerase III subunit delta [Candidatus Heimdallarchaeota archaeon]
MPTLSALDYLKKDAEISEVLAIVGDERFLQIESLEKFKQAIEKKYGMFELTSFTSKQTDVAQVLDEVRSGSLFSNKHLVILDVPTKFFDKKSTKEAIQNYIKKPAKSGFLVIIVPKLNKNSTLHKAIHKSAIRIDCEAIKAYKLADFVRTRAKNYGLKFETDTLDFFVECVGGAVGPAASELDKLSIYLGSKKTVSKQDIENVLGYTGIGNVWQLMDAMVSGNT